MLVHRPPDINEPTWDFLVKSLLRTTHEERPDLFERLGYELPDYPIASNCIPKLAKRPAAFLAEAGIFEHPELLDGMVVAGQDGTGYRIPFEATEAIAAGRPVVRVERLPDGAPREMGVGELRELVANSAVFQQPERPHTAPYGQDQLQRIADHFSIGRITQLEGYPPDFLITTNRGKFVIHESGDPEEGSPETGVTPVYGPLTLLVRTDRNNGLSSVHQNHRKYKMYSVG